MLKKKSVKNAKNIILVVKGGIGRNISATAIVRAIKKAHPKKELHVIAGCPDIFLRNPYIKRVHRLGQTPYLYEDFFVDNKSILVDVEPYQHIDYVYKRKHFIECWCDLLGIHHDGFYPEVFLNKSEEDMAKEYLLKFDNPMILIQHAGGKNPEGKEKKDKLIAKTGMYRRNLPLKEIQKVADYYMERGYMIGSVQMPNQDYIEGAENICFPIRSILALVPYVNGIITIDSFLQHAAACFNRESLVCWGGTSPDVLGYDIHINLTRQCCPTPFCHRPNSYLFDFEPNGFMWDCPHDDICMNYKSDEIIERFNQVLEGDNTDGRLRPNPVAGTKTNGRRPHTVNFNKGCACGEKECGADSNSEVGSDY